LGYVKINYDNLGDEKMNKEFALYFGEPEDTDRSLEYALSLAPAWSNMYISRFDNGWVFVNAHGRYYALDDGQTGWIPFEPTEAERLYILLGSRKAQVYYEELEDSDEL
jgi:hypothetical protein